MINVSYPSSSISFNLVPSSAVPSTASTSNIVPTLITQNVMIKNPRQIISEHHYALIFYQKIEGIEPANPCSSSMLKPLSYEVTGFESSYFETQLILVSSIPLCQKCYVGWYELTQWYYDWTEFCACFSVVPRGELTKIYNYARVCPTSTRRIFVSFCSKLWFRTGNCSG